MRIAYVVILGLMLLCILVCMSWTIQVKNVLAKSITKLQIAGWFGVLAQLVHALSYHQFVSTFSFGVFTISVNFMLLYLLNYTYTYTKNRELPRWMNWILDIVLAVDSISVLVNSFTKHVFELTRMEVSGWQMYVLKETKPLYRIHLLIAYLIVCMVIVLLIERVIHVVDFYRKKYMVILGSFCVLMIADTVSVSLHLAFNISIIFYGLLGIVISYYSLYYQPNELIFRTLSLAAKELNTGIICFDDVGNCIYANERIWNMYGDPVEREKKEQYYLDKIKEGDSKEFRVWTEEIKDEEENKYFEISQKVLKDKKGNLVGYCFTVDDRTEQTNRYLWEIARANKESRQKSEFLSRVSHEIRTPINAIYGMTEMILRESEQPQITEYANELKVSSELLIGIINDVLDFSRIEAGKMAIVEKEYDTREMLSNVIRMIRPRAEDKGLQLREEISAQLPRRLYGDRMRLEQIMINLLTNAVKYTEHGSVLLKADCEREGDCVRLSVAVTDTGMGIKEEDFQKLFTAFERLEETKNHSIEGTGLGLNITSLLLQLMDSSLEVESIYGQGSTFSFVLGQKIVDETPIGDFKEPVPRESKKYEASFVAPDAKVLVVDDNYMNRVVFKKLLQKTQVQIVDVEGGKQCLEAIQKEHFDIIFLDHMMPEMDGVETYEQMKQQEHLCKGSKVIMLTANAIQGAREQYLEMGFDDFLSKPILPDALEKMLRKYLEV